MVHFCIKDRESLGLHHFCAYNQFFFLIKKGLEFPSAKCMGLSFENDHFKQKYWRIVPIQDLWNTGAFSNLGAGAGLGNFWKSRVRVQQLKIY